MFSPCTKVRSTRIVEELKHASATFYDEVQVPRWSDEFRRGKAVQVDSPIRLTLG